MMTETSLKAAAQRIMMERAFIHLIEIGGFG